MSCYQLGWYKAPVYRRAQSFCDIIAVNMHHYASYSIEAVSSTTIYMDLRAGNLPRH